MKKLALLIASLCLTACVSNTYLAKQQYMLQAHQPLLKAEQPVNATLSVEQTLASPPYDNVQFIYRLKNSEYLNDYYNVFMTDPASQVSTALIPFLQAENLFTNVTSADMILPATYTLKTQLTELYADYTEDQHPKAVMEVQFILLNGNTIVYHTLIAAHAPLAEKSTAALVKAWNKDLTIILTKFSLQLMQQFNLKQAVTAPPPPATNTTTAPTADHNFLTLAPQQPKMPITESSKKTEATDDSDDHGFLRLD